VKPKLSQKNNKIEVVVGNIVVEFDTNKNFRINEQSGLISYKKDGKEVLTSAVKPNFWRAPTDNDFGAEIQRRLNVWRGVGYNRI